MAWLKETTIGIVGERVATRDQKEEDGWPTTHVSLLLDPQLHNSQLQQNEHYSKRRPTERDHRSCVCVCVCRERERDR